MTKFGEVQQFSSQNRILSTQFISNTAPVKVVEGTQSANEVLLYDNEKILLYNIPQNTFTVTYQAENRINHVFYDAATKILWVSTQRGLIKLQKNAGIIQNLHLPAIKAPFTDILQNSAGSLYAVSNNSELYLLKKQQFIKIPVTAKRLNRLSTYNNFTFLATDSGVFILEGQTATLFISTHFVAVKVVLWQGDYWLLSEENKIHVYSAKTLKEKPGIIQNPGQFYEKNHFNDLEVSSDDKLWLASWMPSDYGISFYNPQTHLFEQITEKENNKKNFVADYYNRILPLDNGKMAFSSTGGLNVVNKDGIIIQSMNTRENNAASDNILGIQRDKLGNIWFGCAEGLYQYSFKTKKPVRISTVDGLTHNNLTYGFYVSAQNILYAGNENGLDKIDLNKILQTDLINQLKLTAVSVNNIPLKDATQSLSLKEKDAAQIDYYFSALNYTGKEKLIYRYKFDDEEWHYLGTDPKLTLVKVAPGNFNITVEVGDNLGNWQKKSLHLHLAVIAPFYKTIWFYLLSLFILALGAYFVSRYYINQEKQKGILKKTIKENENKMMRSQMNPHFLFNSLNSINSFIIQNKKEDAEKYLSAFAKLIRSILDNSRKEYITLKEELDTVKLYMDLEAVRMDHKFTYQIDIEDPLDEEEILIAPLILQPFLENAIWHGIGQKQGKGLINIDVLKNPENSSQILINIKDNGIGRKASAQSQGQRTHKSHGLEITKERLDMQDNSVIIQDLYDELGNAAGTLITIKIFIEND